MSLPWFFKKDEEIFVEPALATPALSVVAPEPIPAPAPTPESRHAAESKGAKLKIQRLNPAEQPQEAVIAEAPEVVIPAPIAVAKSEPAPATETKSRVIIIRRPASEIAEIPMMDEKNPDVAA